MTWFNANDPAKRVHPMLGKRFPMSRRLAISKALTGKVKSEDHRANLSKSRMGRFTGVDNPFYGKHHTVKSRRIMSLKSRTKGATMLGKKHTPEVRELISKQVTERFKSGWVPWHRKGAYYSGAGGKFWMRSSWEVAFALWMDERDLTWEYEPEGFQTRCGMYIPDFFVHEWHSFVEIKGALIPRLMRKLADFREEYTCYRLVVYDGADLKRMGVLPR